MRTLRWIALVAILLALGGVASAQEQTKEHPLLTKTKQLIKEGKLKEAYRVTGYDIHSTPGVEYVTLNPMYIKD